MGKSKKQTARSATSDWTVVNKEEWAQQQQLQQAEAELEEQTSKLEAPRRLTKRDKRRGAQRVRRAGWNLVDVPEETMWNFSQEGFCRLEELDGNLIDEYQNGVLAINSEAPATEPSAADPEAADPSEKKKKKKKRKSKSKKVDAQEDASADPEGLNVIQADVVDAHTLKDQVAQKTRTKKGKAAAKRAGASSDLSDNGQAQPSEAHSRPAKKSKSIEPSDMDDEDDHDDAPSGKLSTTRESTDKKKRTDTTEHHRTPHLELGRFMDLTPVVGMCTPEDVTTSQPLADEDLAAWTVLQLDRELAEAVVRRGFTAPTPIQQAAIVPAVRDYRDVIAAAPTGSGKTLAFGLPVLQHILNRRARGRSTAGLQCLILTPTRELALQIQQHLKPLATPLSVRVTAIVGGMALVKQERLLKAKPEIVVGTPGRLWEIIQSGHVHFAHLDSLRFLVLDEADRMVERGHFAELDKILARLPRPTQPAFPTEEDAYLQRVRENARRDGTPNVQEVPSNVEEPSATQSDGRKRSSKDKLEEEVLMDVFGTETADDRITQMLLKLRRDGMSFIPTAMDQAHDDSEDEAEDADEAVETDEGADSDDESDAAEAEDDHEQPTEDSDRAQRKTPAADSTLTQLEDKKTQGPDEVETQLALEQNKVKRQTFLFSATLLPQFQKGGRKGQRQAGGKGATDTSIERALSRVVQACGLRKSFAQLDLSTQIMAGEQRLARGLQEVRITCPSTDKEVYLYYFLRRFPGRTLVFVNTIDVLKRLKTVLDLVGLNPQALHAQMQQRQRLKFLDRFKEQDNCVLLATDVAARGLDIQNVQYVVHYQLPKHADSYVHRAGRTARGTAAGLSVVLQSPEDQQAYANIHKTLNRTTDMQAFPVELGFFKGIKALLGAAVKVERLQRQTNKPKNNNNWFAKAAREMDIELDDDLLEEESAASQKTAQQLADCKARLKTLLGQPIMMTGASRHYVSSGNAERAFLNPYGKSAVEYLEAETASQ